MSSVFGLKAKPKSAIALADQAAEVLVQLADHAALLQFVDLDHGTSAAGSDSRSCRPAA